MSSRFWAASPNESVANRQRTGPRFNRGNRTVAEHNCTHRKKLWHVYEQKLQRRKLMCRNSGFGRHVNGGSRMAKCQINFAVDKLWPYMARPELSIRTIVDESTVLRKKKGNIGNITD